MISQYTIRRTVLSSVSSVRRTFGRSLLLLVLFSLPSLGGDLVTHTIESQQLENNIVGLNTSREIQVLLPDSYGTGQQSYPVVYWFAGGAQRAGANIRSDELEAEFASGRADESIIVFVDSISEFGTSLYLSNDVFGNWQEHLTEEIVPFVDATYRTNPTQDQRGIAGFSLGGFTAIMTPLLSPGVFGAVGANDPSVSFISGSVRSGDDLPEGFEPSTSTRTIVDFFEDFPDTVQGYGETRASASAFGQLAVTLSPNPESPLLGDIPFFIDEEANAFFDPEVREIWRGYDLLDPNAVASFEDELSQLSTVSIAVPETAVNTSRAWNRALLREFEAAGISTSEVPSAGDHNDFQHERFAALLGDLTYAFRGENRAVLTENNYQERFDGLSENLDGPATLPAGWSVGLARNSVFRDRTNTPFNTGEVTVAGAGPRILDLGLDSDRALGVHLADVEDTAAIQFLAELNELPAANALELSFNLEVWDKVLGEIETVDGSDRVGFRVSAEFDFGDGFEPLIDLGEVVLDGLNDPTDVLLDGNADENREQFSILGGAPFADALAVRLLLEADASTATPGWVFGIDDVELDFSFRGDFDGDGELTLDDINLLGAATRNSGLLDFDINSDGDVDSSDVEFWVLDLFGSTLGDTNLDNEVDFSDFLRISANFGTDDPVVWQDGDFDGDGLVGFSDFLAFARGFNLGVEQTEVAAVPEPTTLTSALILFFSITLLRKRRGR